MVIKESFTIRRSGMFDKYYIDYNGTYSTGKLDGIFGISNHDLNQIYEKCSGSYSAENNVYYFNSKEDAAQAIEMIWVKIKPSLKGKALYLTEEEVEVIRRALINEDSNILSTNKILKDNIFNKLNIQ